MKRKVFVLIRYIENFVIAFRSYLRPMIRIVSRAEVLHSVFKVSSIQAPE